MTWTRRGGWRSAAMYAGLRRIDYKLVGWGWMLWDVDWFRPRTADRTLARIVPRVAAGQQGYASLEAIDQFGFGGRHG